MPSLAILEDTPQAFALMKQAILNDVSHVWDIVYTSTTSRAMMGWLDEHAVDVLVADLGLPDLSGVEVIKHCKRVQPNTEIMVCTVFEDDGHVFESLREGAHAYLLKADIQMSFTLALAQLLDQGAPMSPGIARRVLQQLIPPKPKPIQENSGLLTPKELIILDLISRGFKYLEIAVAQNISVHTVNTHIKAIYKKLHVASKNEAVYEARFLNLIQ